MPMPVIRRTSMKQAMTKTRANRTRTTTTTGWPSRGGAWHRCSNRWARDRPSDCTGSARRLAWRRSCIGSGAASGCVRCTRASCRLTSPANTRALCCAPCLRVALALSLIAVGFTNFPKVFWKKNFFNNFFKFIFFNWFRFLLLFCLDFRRRLQCLLGYQLQVWDFFLSFFRKIK